MRMITADWLVVDPRAGEAQAAWRDVAWASDPSDLEDTFVDVQDDDVKEDDLTVTTPGADDGPPPIPSWLEST